MSNAITQRQNGAANVIEQVIIEGDLARLTPEQRVDYYARVCESVGLNPYTKPFDYIRLNNRLVLYALKGATDQLRKLHGVSARIVSQERIDDVLVVTVEATDKTGRVDTEIGAVSIGNLKGDALANAMMKALTKAKRRVTLSICGLGMLDETEVESIPDAQHTDHLREVASAAPSNARQTPNPAPQQRIQAGTGQISEQQVKYVHVLANERGWNHDDLHNAGVWWYGVDSVNDLSKANASDLIEKLQQGAPRPVHPDQQPLDMGAPIEVQGRQINPQTGEIHDAPMQVTDPSKSHPITQQLRNKIFEVGRDCGWADEEMQAALMVEFSVESTKSLTIGQAEEFIEYLRAGGSASDMQPALGM